MMGDVSDLMIDNSDDNTINELSNDLSDAVSNENVNDDINSGKTVVNKDQSDSKLSANSFSDIQTKIDNTTEKGTVELSGTYKATSDKNITISKSITIKGNSKATLDFNKLPPCIVVKKSSTLTFENINFINFKDINYYDEYSDTGLIIMEKNSKVTLNLILKNCNFTNNLGSLIIATKLTMTNCNVKNTRSYSSMIFFNNGTIKDSKFINNEGVLHFGLIDSYNKVTCTNCVFTKNSVSDHGLGGAIYAKTAVCYDCIFTSNFADDGGGAIYASTVYCKNCKFSANNVNYGEGGAILGDKITCVTCNFTSNNAIDMSYGGAIFSWHTLNCRDCRFVKNYAEDSGAVGARENMDLKNCKFIQNSAESFGAVSCDKKLTCKGCSFIKNTGFGAIYSQTAVLTKCKFQKNTKGAIFGNKIIINSKKRFKNAMLDNSFKKMELFKIKVSPKSIRYHSGKKITIKVTFNKKPAGWRQIELYIIYAKSKKNCQRMLFEF